MYYHGCFFVDIHFFGGRLGFLLNHQEYPNTIKFYGLFDTLILTKSNKKNERFAKNTLVSYLDLQTVN